MKKRINNTTRDVGEELGMLSLLPFELCIQILSLLPVKSLLVLRAVSKWFVSVIDDDEFVYFHLLHFPDNLNGTQLIATKVLPDPTGDWCWSVIPRAGGSGMVQGPVPLCWMVECSLDGLFLLNDSDESEPCYILWNPSMRKQRKLTTKEPLRQVALGYHNNDYKVFATGWFDGIYIYSVKTDTWTDISSSDNKNNCKATILKDHNDRMSFNGGLVWIGSNYVAWFSFGTESFRVAHEAQPTEFGQLMLLDGGLTIGWWEDEPVDQASSIWALQDTMSWVKRYEVSLELEQHKLGAYARSVVEKNGELVWKYLKGQGENLEVLSYENETRTIKYRYRFPDCRDFYIETLVML